MTNRNLTLALLAALAALLAVSVAACSSSGAKGGKEIICTTERDCPTSLPVCQIDPITTVGKCVAIVDGDPAEQEASENGACTTHAECGEAKYCECGKCLNNSKACFKNSDCKTPCQTCKDGSCIGDPSPCANPVCGDVDGDEEALPGDEDLVETEETIVETSDPDPEPEEAPSSCKSDSECPAGKICGPSRTCIDKCTSGSCATGEGKCNSVTGHCECCATPCASGQACNYNTTSWYCDAPCSPPCPQNYACSGGSCVQLNCPVCQSGYRCAADTCYVCEKTQTGDSDREGPPPVQAACLPPTSPCIEGVSECCSGACIMGHCM